MLMQMKWTGESWIKVLDQDRQEWGKKERQFMDGITLRYVNMFPRVEYIYYARGSFYIPSAVL